MAQAIRTTAKTLEGQFFEVLQALIKLQDDSSCNPDEFKLVEGAFSANNLNYTGNFNFPFEQSMNSLGQLVFFVKPCLSDPTIDNPSV
jgi:hypothetical protein